jgi:hypothetical protein
MEGGWKDLAVQLKEKTLAGSGQVKMCFFSDGRTIEIFTLLSFGSFQRATFFLVHTPPTLSSLTTSLFSNLV